MGNTHAPHTKDAITALERLLQDDSLGLPPAGGGRADKWMEKFVRRLTEMDDAARGTFTERLGDTVAMLRADLPLAAAPGSIERFFTEVGRSMVAAQQQMDQQSTAYNVARAPGALPGAYRIPKVSAELKFAMTHKEGQGFNFLIYGEREEQSRSQQNTLRFEVVAVPPPAALLEELAASDSESE